MGGLQAEGGACIKKTESVPGVFMELRVGQGAHNAGSGVMGS